MIAHGLPPLLSAEENSIVYYSGFPATQPSKENFVLVDFVSGLAHLEAEHGGGK